MHRSVHYYITFTVWGGNLFQRFFKQFTSSSLRKHIVFAKPSEQVVAPDCTIKRQNDVWNVRPSGTFTLWWKLQGAQSLTVELGMQTGSYFPPTRLEDVACGSYLFFVFFLLLLLFLLAFPAVVPGIPVFLNLEVCFRPINEDKCALRSFEWRKCCTKAYLFLCKDFFCTKAISKAYGARRKISWRRLLKVNCRQNAEGGCWKLLTFSRLTSEKLRLTEFGACLSNSAIDGAAFL